VPVNQATDEQWKVLFNLFDYNKDERVSWAEAWRIFKFRDALDENFEKAEDPPAPKIKKTIDEVVPLKPIIIADSKPFIPQVPQPFVPPLPQPIVPEPVVPKMDKITYRHSVEEKFMGSDDNGDWLLNYWEFKNFYLKLRPNTVFLQK